jgi:hypothetical protein
MSNTRVIEIQLQLYNFQKIKSKNKIESLAYDTAEDVWLFGFAGIRVLFYCKGGVPLPPAGPLLATMLVGKCTRSGRATQSDCFHYKFRNSHSNFSGAQKMRFWELTSILTWFV